jgi:hypothetical protein
LFLLKADLDSSLGVLNLVVTPKHRSEHKIQISGTWPPNGRFAPKQLRCQSKPGGNLADRMVLGKLVKSPCGGVRGFW